MLNEPDATRREPASALLENIFKEREKVANKKRADIVAEAQAELDAGRITETEKLLNKAKGLAHATELGDFNKLKVNLEAAIKDEQRKKEELAKLRQREKVELAQLQQQRQRQDLAKLRQGGTWAAFNAECGLQAVSNNQVKSETLFAKNWEGKTVDWNGTVVSVTQSGGGYAIMCKMPGSTSLISDVYYRVPATMRVWVMSLQKGKTVRIQGKIASQGGAITDHIIEYEE